MVRSVCAETGMVKWWVRQYSSMDSAFSSRAMQMSRKSGWCFNAIYNESMLGSSLRQSGHCVLKKTMTLRLPQSESLLMHSPSVVLRWKGGSESPTLRREPVCVGSESSIHAVRHEKVIRMKKRYLVNVMII